MKANLLLHLQSFLWEKLETDRSASLDDLAIAVGCIAGNGDNIYSHPSLFTTSLPWGNLYELLTLDQKTRQSLCPWLTPQHQRILSKLFSKSITATKADSLQKLQLEYPDQNNAWIGISPVDLPAYVCDANSWENLHCTFIYTLYSKVDKTSSYFNRFYKAKLMVPAGTIRNALLRGQTHPDLDRLDVPTVVANDITLHREQIQIHFRDKNNSALNIDGTWKHGGYDIPTEARIQLIEWGFKLPDS